MDADTRITKGGGSMTEEQLNQLKFRFVSHLAMEHEHASSYVNDEYHIGMCVHVTRKPNGEFGRSYRHFRYDGKVYKSKNKLLEAIKEL